MHENFLFSTKFKKVLRLGLRMKISHKKPNHKMWKNNRESIRHARMSKHFLQGHLKRGYIKHSPAKCSAPTNTARFSFTQSPIVNS